MNDTGFQTTPFRAAAAESLLAAAMRKRRGNPSLTGPVNSGRGKLPTAYYR
ncbi:MAG: hypothetical protein GX075_13040 [Firmicutes bacterium]|nr:hypothetical protein [Bacillota bacterium]